MTFTNRVTAFMQNRILSKEYDNFFGDTSFLPFRFMGNAEPWGGETLNIPITIAGNDNGGSFSGISSVSIGTPQTRNSMSYHLKANRQSITIPGLEKIVNRGEEKIVSLIAADMHTAFESMLERVSDQLYEDGTGNGGDDFNGFNVLLADSTITANIGDLSRTTYPTLNGTVTDVGGAIELDDLATFTMSLRAGSGMKNRPSYFLCGETVWNYLEKLIVTGTVQANYQTNGYPKVTRSSKGAISGSELSAGAGFDSIIFRQIPIIFDQNCPANVLWGVNENFTKFFSAKSDDLKDITIKKTLEGTANEMPSGNIGLQWSGWKDAYAEFGELAVLYLFGEGVQLRPDRNGKLTNITGV